MGGLCWYGRPVALDRHPPDDGASAARMIATMVGIVGILLLGSLFWSALGALVSAIGQAAASLPIGERPPTLATPVPVLVSPTPFTAPTLEPVDTPTPMLVEPTLERTPPPTPVPPTDTPTAEPSGRAPWILLPQPAPGTRVQAGSLTLEARGRGDVPVTAMRLELDGAPLPVSLEQRDSSTWRGSAQVKVGAGQHTARAVVTDQSGRSGAFRWTFEADP
jgi:hypothetical protein